MVARRHHNVHIGTAVTDGDESPDEKLLDGGAGLLDVEYIAAHNERVGLVLSAPFCQLPEKALVLVGTAVILVERLPDVQVGGMEELHSE